MISRKQLDIQREIYGTPGNLNSRDERIKKCYGLLEGWYNESKISKTVFMVIKQMYMELKNE